MICLLGVPRRSSFLVGCATFMRASRTRVKQASYLPRAELMHRLRA